VPSCLPQVERLMRFSESGAPRLLRKDHVAYMLRSLEVLPSTYVSLDASRTWLVYWTTHSLDLAGHSLPRDLSERVVGASAVPARLVLRAVCALLAVSDAVIAADVVAVTRADRDASQASCGGVGASTVASAAVPSR
jgi:hypothetical protein